MPKADTGSSKSLEQVLADVRKKSGLSIGPMVVVDKVDALSTGNLAIDYITGVGGMPRGRSIELYGLSGSGKTTCAITCAALAQQQGLKILYLDYEQSLDEVYASALKLDTEDGSFFLAQPDTLEQGAEGAIAAVATGDIGLVVFDSVAGMLPASAIEGTLDNRMAAAERGRLMGRLLTRLNPILARTNTCAIFINHLMEVIETGPTRPGMAKRTTTPGGKALKFYSSMRIEFTQVGQVKANRLDPLTGEEVSEQVATKTKVKVTKSKVSTPYRSCVALARVGTGFDNTWSALQVLTGNNVVKTSTGYHYFPADLAVPDSMSEHATKGPYVHGESAVLALAKHNPEFRAKLISKAYRVLGYLERKQVEARTAQFVDTAPAQLEDIELEGGAQPPRWPVAGSEASSGVEGSGPADDGPQEQPPTTSADQDLDDVEVGEVR